MSNDKSSDKASTSVPSSASQGAASRAADSATSSKPPAERLLAALAPAGVKPDAVEALVNTVSLRAASLQKGKVAAVSIRLHRDEGGALTALIGSSVDGVGEEPLTTVELVPAPAKPQN